MNTILKYITTYGNIVLQALGKFLKWLLTDIKRLIILLLAVGLIYSYFSYRHLENKLENQVVEYADSLTTYKNLNKEIYLSKISYMIEKEALEKKNTELSKEIKNLKDNPLVVTKTEIQYVITEIETTDSLIVETDNTTNSSIYKSLFKYSDDWSYISGYTSLTLPEQTSYTHFDSISVNTDLYLHMIEKDNNFMFISKSSNPYVRINNIDGYMLSPEDSKLLKKKFNKPWGVMVGVGPSIVLDGNSLKIRPTVQLTIGYKLFSF